MKYKILFLLFLVLTFSSFYPQAANANAHPLKINLIYKQNRSGLGRDGELLYAELKKLGHSVHQHKIEVLQPLSYADVNIFLEDFNNFFLSYANKNYLIPNPEWFLYPTSCLSQFDMILCKTQEAENIFKLYHPHTVFMGFTSTDRLKKKFTKQYDHILHLAGTSQQKGTDTVVNAWTKNPHLPNLYLIKSRGRTDYPPTSNIRYCYEFIDDSTLENIQNKCGIHICTSETEGFGHYIMEAFSCKAIVITTDAPPMNEFVKDSRCLVGYNRSSQQNLATNYYVDESQLATVVEGLMKLPIEELKKIGSQNRRLFLKNKKKFKDRLAEIFPIE